ncbi:MAG: UvrD-helicase domain-containing protein [Pseudomonadota bacterium]
MLSQLNPEQRQAVRHLDSPLLVLAGAGSGKTRVITHKIAYLVAECGYAPANIAAITFTNKAAREMQERVAKLLQGRPARGLTVATFHALGLCILRQEAALLGYKPRFSVLDAADNLQIVGDLAAGADKQTARAIQQQISRWKNALIAPQEALLTAYDEIAQRAAVVYRAYQETLAAYQALDFDDLIRLPVALFEQHPDTLAKWQNRLRYLLVDEYQDTNASQYRLLKLLAGPRGALTAVGDDDQSIYAWRGASSDNLQRLQADFHNLQVVKLEQNYRSMARILRAANTLIANNPKLFEKKLWSELGLGDPIQVVAARDEEREAEAVVMRLLAHKFEHRGRFADYAVLYRGNHQARLFEQFLRNERVPYVVSGGLSFFERAEIKDIVAYLRLIANEDDDPAFIRAATTPKRGIGAQTLEKLGSYAAGRHLSLFAAAFEAGLAHRLEARQLEPLLEFCNFINGLQFRAEREPAPQVLEDLLKAIAYETYLYDSAEPRQAETRWANVQDFIGWLNRRAEEDGKNLIELTQTVALISMLENRDDEELDAVRLSTLHAAKGLEFKHVFIAGVEEGILPHRESIDGGQIEEERRLMYVGITRAQCTLHLSYCEKRKRGGEWFECLPSRFLGELPQDDVRISGKEAVVTKSAGNERLARIKAMLGQG